jgi:hypothetical protein
VRVVGEARDLDLPLSLDADKAAARLRGAPATRYQEVWSFLRRRGKQSTGGKIALEGSCPNCGAPMPLSDSVRCEYCKAIVNSGEHDWVLAEITQPEEWRPSATARPVPGLDELRARDPSVSRQELEDRASVVWWKIVDAMATGARNRLERFCLAPGQPPVASVRLSKVAVGSAELVQVVRGQDGLDHAEVELVWSASVNGAAPAGQTVRLVLARAAGAQSKRGLSSLDCPNCGGVLASSDDVKCSYCGQPLPGGRHEWALESFRPVSS